MEHSPGVPLVPEEVLQKVAKTIYGVIHAPKADHAAMAALALGHAGMRAPLPLPAYPPAALGAWRSHTSSGKHDFPCQHIRNNQDANRVSRRCSPLTMTLAYPGCHAEAKDGGAVPAAPEDSNAASTSSSSRSVDTALPSRQGLLQALASMMANKDVKVHICLLT